MATLVDLQSQIEKLQKQASEIRSKEFDKTVAEILTQMQAFGITIKDLQAAQGKTRAGKGRGKGRPVGKKAPAAKKGTRAGIPVQAKFKGPNGETWSGRGLMPKWLSTLVASGRTKEDFAIQA
ncbi:MAG: H-NS histone family protein [Betaproteobacteria bacterium]|nr:H-NS histone family protein [Betaproteobacteria bacterium]NBY72418.1 H-NS histone family protein [Betaproteobacteria bacterium]